MQEEWRDVEGYNGKYQVSNLGQVRSTDRCYKQLNPKSGICEHSYKGKILKAHFTRFGYKRIGLSQKGNVKFYSIHKLVANAFIDNPDNLPCINHIDGDKTNNKVDNLEWCTYSRNNRHARELGLNKGVSYKTRCLKALEYIEKYKYDYEVKERGLHMIQSVVPEFRLSEILKGQITKAQCEKLLQGGDE